MARVYRDYQRDRVGWFFGLTGLQLGVLAAGSVPIFWLIHLGAWGLALTAVPGWVLLLAVVVVPVAGRTAVGWLVAGLGYGVGRCTGWSVWTSRAAVGEATEPQQPDLPGVLRGLRVHETGMRTGTAMVAVVEHRTRRTWAVTAALVHPGIAWADTTGRDRYGEGLAAVLDAAGRTELISDLLIVVRSVPDDGAERDQWLIRHRSPEGPELARRVQDDLRRHLTPGARRSEAFVTFVVPEHRLRRAARAGGPGGSGGRSLDVRLGVMASVAAEMDAYLRGHLGTSTVAWLDSRGLAAACRTGYHPADHATLIDVAAARPDTPGIHDQVPWSLAGPSRAEPAAGCYRHDAWRSVSTAVQLPSRGATLGALTPVLASGLVGERRSLLVAFPILAASAADRRAASREWAADLGEGLRARAKVRPRAQTQADTATARAVDAKLVRGATLCRPYAVATATVGADHSTGETVDQSVGETGRRLDAAVRRAGFAPQRLDLAHDTAFAASCLPLGLTITPGTV